MRRHVAVTIVVVVGLLAPAAFARVWTDIHGNQINATFVRVYGQMVVLRRGQRLIQVPISNLSQEDQQYVRQRAAGSTSGVPDISTRLSGAPQGPAAQPAQPGAAAGQSSPPAAGAASGPRTWTDIHGRTLTAEFVGVSGNQVILRSNGRTAQYPFAGFSREDQQYIESLLKQRGQGHLIAGLRAGGRMPGMGSYPGYGALGGEGDSEGYMEDTEEEGEGMMPPASMGPFPGRRIGPPVPSMPNFPRPGGIGGYTSSYPEEGEEAYEEDDEYDVMFSEGEEEEEESEEYDMYSEEEQEEWEEEEEGYGSSMRGSPAFSSPSTSPPGPGSTPRMRGPVSPLPSASSAEEGSEQQLGGTDLIVYQCSNCGAVLPDDVKVGDRCPKCGVLLEYEETLDGKLRDASGREFTAGQVAARRIGLSVAAFLVIAVVGAIIRAVTR